VTATHPLWRPFEQPTEEEIAAARIVAQSPEPIEVVPYDDDWPRRFRELRSRLVVALRGTALGIEHVGSTSVPGLWAKPYLDIDLIVAEPAVEAGYVPPLEALGFRLLVREPDWEEHRVLKLLDPNTNLHVFPPHATEPRRHLMFRDWLRAHPDDRDAYAAHKREVAAAGFTDGMLYNNAKGAFVYDLYERIFAADPDHPHDMHPRG
jgi:GrpB-like predicted nucleotidyltransferase (UPF0157 family)